MKKSCFHLILFVLLVSVVFPLPAHSEPDNKVPTSSRARKAIAKVTPVLRKKLAKNGLHFGAPIFIRIFKEESELEVWIAGEKRFELFKVYPVCTYGWGGLGPKLKQGDGMAPEGFYFVKPNRLNPVSQFHLSFNLGYPNRYDRAYKRTGSALMVHGKCVSIGCYAMTDSAINEIYTLADAAFRNGQPFFRVHIFPFKMTNETMQRHKQSQWYAFWQNLKEGYDFFKQNGFMPPNVEVAKGRYVFD